MALWGFMKNQNSGIWKPQPTDKFTKKQLLDIQSFFQDDLKKAWADYDRWNVFTKAHPNLTQSNKGFKGMLQVCQRAIFESEQNLKVVGTLIELNK
jgi:hypothetical protein